MWDEGAVSRTGLQSQLLLDVEGTIELTAASSVFLPASACKTRV